MLTNSINTQIWRAMNCIEINNLYNCVSLSKHGINFNTLDVNENQENICVHKVNTIILTLKHLQHNLLSYQSTYACCPSGVCAFTSRKKKENIKKQQLKTHKQDRGNSHTVTRPVFIQWQLVPPSAKAPPGQNKTGYTFGKSASAPTPSANREANHNFTLWFVKSQSGTRGTRKLLGHYISWHTW